jgi:hypothetical protein
MSDILKNVALKGIQHAMSMAPIGGKNEAAKKIKNKHFFELREAHNTPERYRKYQMENPKTNTNPTKPTLKPDLPKNTNKSKTNTARPRRAN